MINGAIVEAVIAQLVKAMKWELMSREGGSMRAHHNMVTAILRAESYAAQLYR